MYNIYYLPQLETSQKHLFGNLDPRDLPASAKYSASENMKSIECAENINGEWVPKKELEKRV